MSAAGSMGIDGKQHVMRRDAKRLAERIVINGGTNRLRSEQSSRFRIELINARTRSVPADETRECFMIVCCFILEAKKYEAGLLTFPYSAGLPIPKSRDSGIVGESCRQLCSQRGITAASTVPDLHRIPF